MRKYTEKQINFVKDNVKGITLKELTERFNKQFDTDCTENCIRYLKSKYNLKSTLGTGRFQKGHKTWNKGKKMTKEQYEKSKGTMFKKGNIPKNSKPVGTERTNVDGYTEIKVQNGHLNKNWVLKHRYIYEKEKGKIPEGYKVLFADRNKNNFDIDNLILVSQAEELIMNQNKLIKSNKELTKTGLNIAKVLKGIRSK